MKRIGACVSSAFLWGKKKPLLALLCMATVAALGVGSYKGYRWWQSRPKPHQVTFQVTPPARTEIEAEEESQRGPKPLTITFGESVAPLAAVGKEVPSGISMQPAISGIWRWQGDRTLSFAPKDDWPIGENYEVRFQPSVFKPGVKLAQKFISFSAPAFDVKVAEAKFYQDPLKADQKKVVINLGFSYPVNPSELEKRISLKLAGKDPLKFSVTYDALKLKAFIQSETLAIPKEDMNVEFKLAQGTTPMKGGKAFPQDLTQNLAVPGLYSLSLSDFTPQVVTNDKDEPEQVLMINASADLDGGELTKAMSVWVLPKFPLDHQPTEDEAPYAWTETEVTPEVLNKSVKLLPEAIPNEEEHSTIQSYKYHADVGDRLFIQVKEGLKSFGGYVLPKDVLRIVEVPAYPSELKIMSKGALLALSGEKKVGIQARDLPGIKVEIGRVLPSQIQNLVSQTYGDYDNPEFFGHFKADNIIERFERNIALPNLKRGQSHYESLDLAEYLRAPGAEEKRGVFLLTVQGYDPAKEAKKAKCEAKKKRPLGAPPADPDEYVEEEDEDCRTLSEEPEEEDGSETLKDSRMVLVTDLGILVKEWVNGTQEVFVQSIYTGQPVAGARVEILGKNGVSLFSQVTDAEGRARFAKIENLSREHKPTLILVQKGNDLIYRPGDTFHLGMIVKPARWDTNIVGLSLLVEALDSRGLTILSEKLKVPAGGFLELTHALEESAPEGTYDINLYLVKDDKAGAQVGSAQIKVQEFLPDRMKVTAKLSAEASEGWVSPEGLKALVQAQNLFGTPAENRRVTGEMSLNPAFPQFPNYSDYEFYDPHRAKEGYTEELGEAKTDAQGNAEFDLRLGKYAKATYRLSFLAEVFEPEGGRSVAASTTALVSDLPYLIGFKADGALEYVARGSKRGVSLIAIDPKLRKTAVNGLTLQRIETLYVSVLNKQEDGTYNYESRKKEVKGPESPLEIPATGYALALDTTTPGDFAYTVRDAQGNEVNRIEYSVAGQGNVTRSLERNAELKLALNKKEYSPGEEIEVSIRAPYVGAGLITIERDKVYAVQWFKSETLASVQKIRVPADFEGNGYVSVQFIRDPSSDEIFMSPLSYGVAPFSGSLSGVTNHLKLTAPERMKPGEILNIQLQAEQPTKAVVF
ncbi:MAG: alpha-2-macroglobulin, partial [Deltaproteobacteria bacterium]|nr:alpha-2-macroglobulin [Deltaproteobacteria bacterium]